MMLLQGRTSKDTYNDKYCLGPCVQFLLKLMRIGLICKFNINPSDSSLLPCGMGACEVGLSLFQQELMSIYTSDVSGCSVERVVCMFVNHSLFPV